MKIVRIDRSKHLCDQPETGHNRWHPAITPIVEVEEGEEIALETRDATDGYVPPTATPSSLAHTPTAIHPLTGPVAIKGARPGDLLEIEFLDIQPQRTGVTLIRNHPAAAAS